MNILRSFPRCFLLFFFTANSVWAVDPTRHISQYAHTAWRVQDGVFSGIPLHLAQTTDGYLWIGTTSGLWRFDGVRFVPWILPEGQQLPSSQINSLLGTPDGSLWVGTGGGLSRWRDHQLTNYSTERGIVTAIVQARDGTIWIELSDPTGKTGPLCQIIGTGMRCHGKDDGIPADFYTPMAEDRQGIFWLGGGTTLVGWKWNSHLVYKPRGLKSNAGGGIDGLAADPDGSLWVGIARSGPGLGLQHLTQGIWKPFRTPEVDGSTMAVATLLLDRENALWVGTPEHGLYRIFGGKVEHFGSADGLSGDHVVSCFEDREGNLWVLTSKGIDSLRDMRIASFSTREGLGMEEVDSVLVSRNGAIWIGGTDSLDAIYHDRISSIKPGKGLPGHQVTSLFEDHLGRLWVGLDDGLTVYENGKFHRVKRRNGSSRGFIVGIAEDVDHNIWVETGGRDRSLIRIQDLVVREEFPVPRMPAARRVAADPGGGLWLGLMNGDLARYQHGQTETFHFQHVPDSRVEQVTVNPDGSVLGATAFGVIGWSHGKQLTLTTRNGLPCNSVYAFVSDQRGNLWLNTQCALVEITSQDLQKWWQDPDVVVQPRVFDVLDGAQPDWVPFAAAARSPDGRLWFADSNRLQMIDPNHLAENPIPPPVHVEQVIADRKNYSPRQDLRLPPHTRDLEIDYTALSFVVPQKVRFRYKLEGRDTTWQEPGTRRQAFYNDLHPGRYRFRVIACNNDGVWNDAGATLDFSVAPAWYQTDWFRILCIVSGVCIVVVLYRLRVRQIARAIGTRFNERLAERTRMARDLHDTFLQTIQGSKLVADDALDEPSDPVRMRRAMEKLSEWLGQATQEGRAALNSLRTSTTEANDLAQALQRATEDGPIPSSMAVNFTVVGDPQRMHPIVRDEIYRIGYEAIHNAHVHSSASHLEVDLSYGQDLSLRVADNGVGIDSDVADQGKVGHFGLQGMRERAVRIGAKLTLASSSALGTEIKLVVPGGIVFQKTGPVRQTLLTKIRAIIWRTNQPSKLD